MVNLWVMGKQVRPPKNEKQLPKTLWRSLQATTGVSLWTMGRWCWKFICSLASILWLLLGQRRKKFLFVLILLFHAKVPCEYLFLVWIFLLRRSMCCSWRVYVLQLKDLTVVELKYYLTAHNLPVAGKKEALISRILTHMGKWATWGLQKIYPFPRVGLCVTIHALRRTTWLCVRILGSISDKTRKAILWSWAFPFVFFTHWIILEVIFFIFLSNYVVGYQFVLVVQLLV
jgi:hypothetical protein